MNPIDPRGLTPPLTEARLARQYAAIAARTRGRPRGRAWRLGWAVATAAAGAAVFLFVWAHRPASNRVASSATSSPIDGALIEAPPTDGVGVTLGDGSYVALAAGTRARFTSDRPTAVRIDLERGAVEIEATHVEGRRFTVGAGSYEVRVVGTHFVVRRAPHERVEVRVDRGAVEIASGGGETRTLRAGEQWSAPDGAVDAPASASPSPSAAEDREPPQGPEAAERTAPPPARAPVGPASPAPRETAKGLFDEAQRERSAVQSFALPTAAEMSPLIGLQLLTSPVSGSTVQPTETLPLLRRHVPGSAQLPVVEWQYQRIHVWPSMRSVEAASKFTPPRFRNTPSR